MRAEAGGCVAAHYLRWFGREAFHRAARLVDGLRSASPWVVALRQYRKVEVATGRIGIVLEFDRRLTPLAAVKRGVFDPLAKRAVAPQLTPDSQAEPAGFGVVESRRFAAGAAVPVNEAQLIGSDVPSLFDDGGHRRPNKITGAVAVQIDLCQARLCGILGHAVHSTLAASIRLNVLYCADPGGARKIPAMALIVVQSPVGLPWKLTAAGRNK